MKTENTANRNTATEKPFEEILGVVRFARFTGTIDSLQEFLLVNTLTNLYEELTDCMEKNEDEKDN